MDSGPSPTLRLNYGYTCSKLEVEQSAPFLKSEKMEFKNALKRLHSPTLRKSMITGPTASPLSSMGTVHQTASLGFDLTNTF